MTRAVVLPVAAPPYEADATTLDDLQRLVGGYIEAVRFMVGHHELTGYINEEGKLQNLPPNLLATALTTIYPHDLIAGPMVVLGPPDADGDDTDIPPPVAAQLLRLAPRDGGSA